MDKPVKEGQLYVQQQKFGRKWKKNWFVLYPASQYGIARLEFFDSKEANTSMDKPNTKKLDKKIIRLADCISIVPAVTESCPKDSMAAFSIETSEKMYCFATEQQASKEWVEKLCEIAFSNPSADSKRTNLSENSAPTSASEQLSLQMAENSIYYSRDEVNEFWVSVQKTEASERCNLQGSYILKADKENLILKDSRSKQVLYTWPYKLLRRYGRDKVMFSFEAGRRCETGAGNFTFETKQGNDIFLIVEAAIKEQKAQAEENRQSFPSLDSESSFALQLKNAIAESMATGRGPAITEPTLDSPGSDGMPQDICSSKPSLPNKPSTNDLIGKWEHVSRSSEEKETVKLLKVRSLPDPPVSLSKAPRHPTPPRSPLPKLPKSSCAPEDPSVLYSEPLDALKVHKPNMDSLYSDPIDSVSGNLQLKGQRLRSGVDEGKSGKPYPLYSDLYEQVSYELAKAKVTPKGDKGKNPEEHIYDEPEGRLPISEGRAQQPLPTSYSIYDEACPSSDAWKKQGIEEEVGHEIPYNPNTDDYSVPAQIKSKEPQTIKQKGPRPIPLPKPPGAVMLAKNSDRNADVREPPERVTGKTNFNNSNNSSLYSTVVRPAKATPASVSKNETFIDNGVNETSRPESVYEDLGEL